jgi:phosphoglycerate dehydrogenase-like enzyme
MRVIVAIYSAVDVWTIPDAHVERLRGASPGVTIVYARDDRELERAIGEADVAFTSVFGERLLALAPRLRWIHSPAAGVGNMLHAGMRRSRIVITNSRGIHAQPIAEHVIGVTLALARQLHVAIRRQREGVWAQHEIASRPIVGLRGARMGLVGLGAIGSAIARLAAAMGMEVAAVRRNPDRPVPQGVARVLGPAQLPELVAEADVVVLAAPLTGETRGLVGAAELDRMKRSAILVNVGRGRLVDEQALARALAQGTIAGAALDVFTREPLDPASPFWTLENVIVTPHTSGLREDYWEAVVDLFVANLGRFTRGEPLLNIVDKQAGY